MTIKIEQICNKCGKKRELKVGGRGASSSSIRGAAEQGGWRDLNDKDICETCISDFLVGTDA